MRCENRVELTQHKNIRGSPLAMSTELQRFSLCLGELYKVLLLVLGIKPYSKPHKIPN